MNLQTARAGDQVVAGTPNILIVPPPTLVGLAAVERVQREEQKTIVVVSNTDATGGPVLLFMSDSFLALPLAAAAS